MSRSTLNAARGLDKAKVLDRADGLNPVIEGDD